MPVEAGHVDRMAPPPDLMPDTPVTIEILKKRPEFLAVAKGRKTVRNSLILQSRRTSSAAARPVARVGFTVTKRVGGAVERNRVKRRLRAAAMEILPKKARPGMDYVLIGRAATRTVPFSDLLRDLSGALDQAAGQGRRAARKTRPAGDRAATGKESKS